jgi:hypothetical protein
MPSELSERLTVLLGERVQAGLELLHWPDLILFNFNLVTLGPGNERHTPLQPVKHPPLARTEKMLTPQNNSPSLQAISARFPDMDALLPRLPPSVSLILRRGPPAARGSRKNDANANANALTEERRLLREDAWVQEQLQRALVQMDSEVSPSCP